MNPQIYYIHKYNRFIRELRGKQDIEKAINNKLNELKKFKFRTSKGLGRKSDPKSPRFEDITIDQIKDMILSLRKSRILFLEGVLNEYRENKVKYTEFLGKQKY
ncbi:hypothetical protein LCGC14_1237530 [marine sediment metagenome]|uniref:Uncharacterized protein n=1 Tax=marine sediment metagenome TaxID=412755 RepID=A0A0F9NNZ5_9ZZZZ